jgi:hypothetical protein
MDEKQVEKSIKQMRGIFAFIGAVNALVAVLNLFSDGGIPIAVIGMIIAAVFFMAFKGLGDRTQQGYTFARIASGIMLLFFPLFTIFGVMYLIKLGKPEMKAALSG